MGVVWMYNVYDIRKDRNLYFVLSDRAVDESALVNKTTAVMMFLYYEESLQFYLSYIDEIPAFIDIYFVSSNEKLYLKVKEFVENKIVFVKSKNRGRDVSALLVACKDIALNYEYICFIHDKKRKDYLPEKDFNLWIENLWGNLLGSKNYILNILNVLDTNKELGLLTPPEPIGDRLSTWYDKDNAWGENGRITRQLAENLDLKCDIDLMKPPITFGTAFWAKSDALKKLLEKNWTYEDFDEEPLKDDGTISHAIERVLGYVAQDAGYNTGTVMNASYAEKLICITQEFLSETYHILKTTYGISPLKNLIKKKEELCSFCKENTHVYLYGAGKNGKRCLQLLRIEGYEPEGYIVSEKRECNLVEENLPVKTIDEIDCIDRIGIIITVGMKFQKEVEGTLKLRGIKNYVKYIDCTE